MRNFLCIALTCIALQAPSQNTPVNLNELEEWETIYNGDISNNGNWMFYTSQRESAIDTIFVKETSGEKLYKIPGGSEGKFTNRGKYFISLSENSGLTVINLEKDVTTQIDSVRWWYNTSDENFLMAKKQHPDNSELLIKNLNSGQEMYLNQLEEFKINPLKNQIAFSTTVNSISSVKVIDLNTYKISTFRESKEHRFDRINWSEDGNTLAFFEILRNGIIGQTTITSCSNGICKQINKGDNNILNGIEINREYMEFTDNGDFVLFKGKQTDLKSADQIPKGVQRWLSKDKVIYPRRKMKGNLDEEDILFSWNIKSGAIKMVTDSIGTKVEIVSSDFILKIDELAYEPQFKFVADVDYYRYNLKTGTQKLVLKKQNPDQVFTDPLGKFLVFFKDNAWRSYDIYHDKYYDLSSNLTVPFASSSKFKENQKTPYSTGIKWVTGENAILVYDEFDVWKLSLDGRHQIKLTNGRELKRIFRPVVDFAIRKKMEQNAVNLKTGLLLHAVDENMDSGYFLQHEDGSLACLAFGPFGVDGIKWTLNMDYITFRLQSYTLSPQLHFYDRKKNITTTLVKSNEKQNIKNWGTTEILEYKMKDGSLSKAFLIYPINYNPEKIYPMIVFIYEKQTKYMNDFYPLSEWDSSGFNPTHYALDGYFVLMPNIEYEVGNPGLSALKYVDESIDYILEKVKIDSTRIGLNGFSFGGYESAFIATQTNRFAAVVAGAAITNMVSYYHTINWGNGKEEMWRMEDYQMRMGKPYYERKEAYVANSPFHSIENMNTPMLLWSGANDFHVDYLQSIHFYLGLRRLHKNAELLLFEDEGHSIMDYKKKKYLGVAVKNWFDKYCK